MVLQMGNGTVGAASPHLLRRRSLLLLLREFADDCLARGEPLVGMEAKFAESVGVHRTMLSKIKTSRPIGDKLARQIEHARGKPAGWLDLEHDGAAALDGAATEAEAAFLEICRQAWRSQNARGKRALRTRMRELINGAAPSSQ